jgi:hypothetical protein
MPGEKDATKGMRAGRRLYLYSSNSQPLYAQHALNILAMPAGQLTTLRYAKKWVDSKAQELWGDDLKGLPVLMHFSLQQVAEYVEPALFPIRSGRVTDATKEGPYHFVEVQVQDYVSLKSPPYEDERKWEPKDLAQRVAAYQDYLKKRGIGKPYSASASLATDVLDDARNEVVDVATVGDPNQLDVELFRRNASYLQRTQTFEHARFLRFLRLSARGKDQQTQHSLNGDPPQLELLRSHTYDIELFSYQPRAVEVPQRFVVSADDVSVQVIGQGRFDVGSRYDRISIAVRAQLPPNADAVQTLVLIEPAPGVDGPTIELPIQIQEPKGVRWASVAAAVSSLGLLVAASVVSGIWWKAALFSAGLLLAFYLQLRGRPIASLVGPAVSGLPARPATPTVVVESTSPTHTAGPPRA